jgi:hypothetical protein
VQELRPAIAAAARPVFMINIRREIGNDWIGRFMIAPYGWNYS